MTNNQGNKASSNGKAARRYPNQLENMQAAKKAATKDPAGGLTAAVRADFARKKGAHLKPWGVKADKDITLNEMQRKGSWAARFYGRASLPRSAPSQRRAHPVCSIGPCLGRKHSDSRSVGAPLRGQGAGATSAV